mmetsp:Transcript_54968/g.115031  ORF Transcript_54968/g.115031 Transcript_54968/m.115031 type:complete len:480 (-) Transcript_54968:15-1454(-)
MDGASCRDSRVVFYPHGLDTRMPQEEVLSAAESLAAVQVGELGAALEATHAALEGQTAELTAAQRALSERDAAEAEKKTEAYAAISEESGPQAQQAVIAAAVESAAKAAEALLRTLEALLSARPALVKAAGKAAESEPEWQHHATPAAAVSAQTEGLSVRHETELGCKLQAQIERFLLRTNNQFVERVFNTYADSDKDLILPNRLQGALSEFGAHLPSDEVEVLMTAMDINHNGGLDLREFSAFLRQLSTPVEQFAETLPISGMLASSLAIPEAGDPLKELCNLGSDHLKTAIDAFSISLHLVLRNQLDHLKTLIDAKEANTYDDVDGSGSKCAVFVMNAGSVDAYHEGIYERIGAPNLKFLEGIESEHTEMAGCDRGFTTSNYLVTTTPRKEYDIATGKQECPEKDMLDRKQRKVRRIQKIDMLTTLEVCKRAGLMDYEILALVLYTGPMFQVGGAAACPPCEEPLLLSFAFATQLGD